MTLLPLARDLRRPRLIIAKGLLFLLAAVMASAAIVITLATAPPGPAAAVGWRILLLHALAVWCFCRAYYFAFYVIQHYIDPAYRFAGLISTIRWLAASRRRKPL